MIIYMLNILQYILLFSLRIEKASFPRPLSKKEERDYFEKINIKGGNAKEMLIKHNLRLVAHVTKKYYYSNDKDDLISIGTIGLIKAVNSYDIKKNIKFATYASRCIENEILMYFRQIKKNVNNLYSLDNLRNLNKSAFYLCSKDLVGEEDILEIIDLRVKSKDLYALMDEALTPREKKVLVHRYGLYGSISHTQQETANLLKISRSYVSRIEKKAIQTLSKKFKEKYKD